MVRFCRLVITCIIAGVPLISPAQELYRDEFNANNENWWVGETDDYEVTLNNGTYQIRHKNDDGQWFFWKSYSFDRSSDYIIEANIKQIDGITNHGYGLLWGAKDANNLYCFIANSNGSYFLYKYEEGKYNAIKSWTNAENAINPVGFSNKFQIKKIGDNWSFFINDNSLYSMPVSEEYGDYIGFVINDKMTIAAENISISQLASLNYETGNMQVIFDDHFNNNDNDWSTGSKDISGSEIKNGKYILEHKRDEGQYYYWKSIEIDQSRDFEIIADIRQVSGVEDRGFGLTWGMKDVDNDYTFYITSSGYYRIYTHKNNEFREIKEFTYVPGYINPMGSYNSFKIRKTGDQLHFFLNENYVTNIPFEEFLGHNIGFILTHRMKIEVDRLTVKEGGVSSTEGVFFTDNFSDNRNKWLIETDDKYITRINNGHYRIERLPDESLHYFWNDINFRGDSDFTVETDIRHIGGADDYGFGITWGLKDINNLFAFYITNSGFYRIYKIENGEFNEIIEWTEVPRFINPTGTYNHFKFERKGSDLYFYINDHYLNRVPFEEFFDDQFGFVVANRQTIEIDKLTIDTKKEKDYVAQNNQTNITQTTQTKEVALPPDISWILPENPVTQTREKNYNLSTVINSKSSLVNVTVLLNNSIIQVPEATNLTGRLGSIDFNAHIKLLPGSNDLKIIAANKGGSATSQSRTIIYSQPQPPVITWLNPTQAFSTSGVKNITIKAGINTSNKLKSVDLLVNDNPVDGKRGFAIANEKTTQNTSGYDFVLDEAIELKSGDNLIKVIAENLNGSSAIDVRTITYAPSFAGAGVKEDNKEKTLYEGRTDYALLFATDQYDHWNDLVNPVNDAKTIAKELENNYGFDVELVLNPTTADVMKTLKRYANKSYMSKDQLFIFFAGHGTFDQSFGEGYLVCKNSLLDDEGKLSYIPHSTLRTVVNNIPSEHIFVAMDVCFGGTFDQLTARADHRGSENIYRELTPVEIINRKLEHKTRRYLTSGGKEYVPDGRPGYHSPFARKMIEALRSGDNILTIPELLSYLETVNPQPRYGEFGDNEPGSDFLFIHQ